MADFWAATPALYSGLLKKYIESVGGEAKKQKIIRYIDDIPQNER